MRAFLAVMSSACWLLAASVSAQPAPPKDLTAEQWREDLRFAAGEMRRRHANLYHHVDKATFDRAVADLDARIPSLSRNRIIVGMMRIAALVGDGHTRIEPRKDPAFGFRSLPVKLYWFEDGLFVRAAAPAHAALVGAKVEAIGGVPIADAMARAAELASRENELGPKLYIPIYLGMPDILEALGLSDSGRSARLTLSRGGRRWTATVETGEVAPLWPADTDISLAAVEGWTDARKGPLPLWLQAPLDYHRLIELTADRALYVQLNMVTDTKEQSLARFGERIRERATASNPRAIILDLRLNQGGNGDLRHPFVRSLIKAEDADTRLFVLAARGTFSASQFILDDLDRLTDAIFIGEPASSRPTGHGDAFRAAMPNSGINVRTSIKYWQSGQDMRDWTPIDVAAPLTFADYAAGRDPAMAAALAYAPGPDFSETAIAAAKAGGAAAVTANADAMHQDPKLRYADRPRMLARAMSALSRAKLAAEALALGRWALARYPRHDGIATMQALVAEAAGDKAEARRAAAAALAIDPNNRQATTVLRNLGT